MAEILKKENDMGIQDKTEQVLRKLHILLSQSEVYDEATSRVIVDKKAMIGLLQELNSCIYGMMDEYEVTQQGKDKAARDTRKVGEEIIRDAKHTAEDVYAASVMYTDEALRRAMDIVDEAIESMKAAYRKMEGDLQSKKDAIAHNKLELKSQLQDLKDTEKYLQLIEERNKQIAREKNEEQEAEVSPTAHIKPEIRINMDYFVQNGIPIEPDIQPQGEEKASAQSRPQMQRAEKAGGQKTPQVQRAEKAGGQKRPQVQKAEKPVMQKKPQVQREEKPAVENVLHDAGYEEDLDAEMLELEEILKEGMKESGQEPIAAENKTDAGGINLADKIVAQTTAAMGREEFADETVPVIAEGDEEVYDYGDEPEIKVTPEIRVNLDAEYFKWKENMEIEDFGSEDKAAGAEKKAKSSRFGRKK